MSEDKVE